MQRIMPHLWFDTQAKEAVELYTSIVPNSKITNITTIHNTPSGDCDIFSFELSGQPFMAINAGPVFKFNPSISFHIKCKTKEEVDNIWEKLLPGAKVLMEIGSYPFSQRYGWIQDKYGVSWQVIYPGEVEIKQVIIPVLMFVGDVCGKTEEATKFYTSVFADSKIDFAMRYEKGQEPDKEGTIKYTSFTLGGVEFGAMDSAQKHEFSFTEALSLLIPCETQEEIDYFWEKLSAVPEAEQCGWLKDKYGVTWQVWPTIIGEMMKTGTQEQIDRLTQAFLPMKKYDIEKLRLAFEGK